VKLFGIKPNWPSDPMLANEIVGIFLEGAS
jgi:hypothetical protein